MAETLKPVMIAAGGTGGHIYPALAVAAELRGRGRPLLWLGNPDGMEAGLSSRHGYQLLPLCALPLRNSRGVIPRIKALLCLVFSVVKALLYVRQYKPAAVLGMGGYVSAAAGVAASLSRVPLCLQEQNAVPGLVNRWLAPLAAVVMEGYQGSFPGNRHAVCTGNPVRAEFSSLSASDRTGRPAQSILLLGGSQGAATLNEVMPQAWQFIRQQSGLRILHQSGVHSFDEVVAAYGDDARVKVSAYIDDVVASMVAADLVVCRAGAMTLAEVAAAGLPAVIVPYRYAADNHQGANAARMAGAGAAVVVPDQECTPRRLADVVLDLLQQPEQLATMAAASSAMARTDAAARVACLCLEAIHE